MDFKVPSNLQKEKEFIVEEQYLATFLGSGSVEVLSTPSMILFMEMVSRIMMDEVLPTTHTTVGTQVWFKVPDTDLASGWLYVAGVDFLESTDFRA